jgi:hypothetical protein
VDAPEVVVRALLLGRRPERGDVDAHRVDALEDLANDPVLPGCIEPLQHEQHAALALGEQPPLKRGEAFA